MVKRRVDSIVECLVCHTLLGTVFALEDSNRPGFHTNVTEPEEIPKVCPSCKEPPVRTMQPSK